MWSDLRSALRSLRATPMAALAAGLSLALGLGANTAIFSIANSLLLRDLPVTAPDRLATISSDAALDLGFSSGAGWSYPMWQHLSSRLQGFDGAFAWHAQKVGLGQGGERQPAEALIVSGGFFGTLGVGAQAGRTLTPADDQRGGGADGPAAVISHRLWQRRFGGAPVVGSVLFVEGAPFTIVGVTPPEFFGIEPGRAFDVALPLGAEPHFRGKRALIDDARAFVLSVMVRLKPAMSLGSGTALLRALQPELESAVRVPKFAADPITLAPASAGVQTPGSARPKYAAAIVTVLALTVLVLLVTCANVANLLLARSDARRQEWSVRLALGASRWLIVRQMLIESLVLAGAGAIAGVVFAYWASRALVAQLPLALPAALDARVLAVAAAVAIATAALFGAAPAWRAARLAAADGLREQPRGTRIGATKVVGALVVSQVAVSFVLVVAAGLLAGSFRRLASVPLGFDGARVLLVDLDLARARIPESGPLQFVDDVVRAATAVPGVEHAAASFLTPINAGLQMAAEVEGGGGPEGSGRRVLFNVVTPGWFDAYGTRLREGRDFVGADGAGAAPVAIVNHAFVRRFLTGGSALGRTVSGRAIVGVVDNQIVQGGYKPDGSVRSVRDDAPPIVYLPLAQSAGIGPPNRTTYVLSVRSAAGKPTQLTAGVAAALTQVDRALAFTVRPLDSDLRAALAQDRVMAALAGFFGLLAALLAGVGLYGVTAYGVGLRMGEIGLRLALGATPGRVQRLVLGRVAFLVGVGLVAGIAVSLGLLRFITSLLFGVGPRDPLTLAIAAALLAGVGAIAGWLPALRAARVDPADVLRRC